MTLHDIVAAAGAALGAGMGLYAMIDPAWAARLVRLQSDPARPGGFAEFRATYGGLFLASHAGALIALLAHPAVAPWIALPLGLGWAGAGVGRMVSIGLDKVYSPFNAGSVIFELAMGAALLAPAIART
jgi:hypothetical protein